ncbi:MAG: immunoglobulin-like domain-containing protein [Clostridiaceae bacterium]|nr:immunoglobulin-like domain-containing protein [Clostridiaceae bacterium]
MLNFKKPSRVIIIVSVALVAVLSVGFTVNRVINRDLAMQGTNLSDLQTEALIEYIVKVTGAKDESVIISPYNFELNVSDNFDWIDSATISMLISRNKTGGSPYYACQLRIISDEQNYFITEPQRQDPPDRQYLLKNYLDALKYLPQEHIQSLISDKPDMYKINIVDSGFPDDNQRCVFYNMDGLTDNSGWLIRLDIQPLYEEDGGGYQGLGSNLIHVFYTGSESDTFSLADGWVGNLNSKPIRLDDVRALAKKGDDLLFEDFQKYKGANVSSTFDYYIMVYGVEGGYRLIVRSDQSGRPDSVNLENIWESGGSGIDIRYGDIDEFLSKWPIIMQVKDGTATPSGVTITLKNVTDTEYTYGESYTVQRKTVNGWIDVEPVIEKYAFNSVGYMLSAMGSEEIIIDWEWLYGKIPAGDYRIAKEALFVRSPGDYDTFTLYSAFTIVK